MNESSNDNLPLNVVTGSSVYWAFPCAVLCAFLALIGWGNNRGIEMVDPTLYALLLEQPTRYPFFSDFALILHVFPILNSNSILHLRALALILLAATSAIFSCGFLRWWEQAYACKKLSLGIWLGGFASTLMGCFLSGKWQLSCGYNTLSFSLLLSACGLFFYSSQSKDLQKLCFLTLAGFMIGISIFVKFPASLALLCLIVLLLCCNRKLKMASIILMLVGVAMAIATYFLCFRSFESWLAGPYWGIQQTVVSGYHEPSTILKAQTKMILHHLKWIVPSALIMLAWLVILRKLFFDRMLNKIWKHCIVAIITVVALAVLSALGLFFVGYFWWAMFPGFILYIFIHRNKDGFAPNSEAIRGSAFAMLLPLVLSFGTNNFDLLAFSTINIAPALLCIYLCCSTLCKPIQISKLLVALIPSMMLVLFSLLFFSKDPMTGMAPLATQNAKTDLSRLEGLLMEPHLNDYFDKAYALLRKNEYKQGDILLIPDWQLTSGLLYAVGGISPGLPYTYSMLSENAILLDSFLQTHKTTPFYVALLSENNKRLPPIIEAAIKKNGILFPDDFKYLGSIENVPDVDLVVFGRPMSSIDVTGSTGRSHLMPPGTTEFWSYSPAP